VAARGRFDGGIALALSRPVRLAGTFFACAFMLAACAAMPRSARRTGASGSCEGGDADACMRAAAALEAKLDGHQPGDERQRSTVAAYYRKACDAGRALGCFRLATLTLNGTGVEKNEAAAAELDERACVAGVVAGCDNAALLYQDKNDARALALVQHGCDLGDGGSCGRLAFFLLWGNGVTHDEPRAFEVALKACDLGHAMSCRNAGNMILAGSDANKDLPRAASLFDKACQGGDMLGCGNRGAMLFEGIGVARDESGGVALMQRACDGGMTEACGSLGWRYRDGQGVPRDVAHAVALFERACDTTLPPNEKVMRAGRLAADACRAAALLYRDGADGVQRDPALADQLLQKACARGDSASCP
jgi:TPR repeat protein